LGTTKILQPSTPSSSLERVAYTLAEFCYRNQISRPAYHRLRAEGRGPAEMRIGLNMIRITCEAERDWQRAMEEPNAELEQQAIERAVRAGEAAVKSNNHISKRGDNASDRSLAPHRIAAPLRNTAYRNGLDVNQARFCFFGVNGEDVEY
jgi:hypothetical protein